ncbi:hypothetical protein ABIC42_002176 [Variovorax sp. 1133]
MDHHILQPSHSYAAEQHAAFYRFVVAALVSESRRAAACGGDPEPYNERAGQYLDQAAATYLT